MKVCDAHVHLGESGPWQPYGDPTIYIESLMPILDKHKIARALVFPNPNVGDKYPETNDYIAQCVRKYSKRLVGFGRIDPRRGADAVKELERIKSKLKLSGIKLHPMVECFRPDHPFFAKFFKQAEELRLPVLIHTGDGFSAAGLAAKVAKKHPHMVMILAHLREGCVSALKDSHNIHVETSGTLPEFVEMATDVDENRVLFGSDIPYYRFPTQAAIIEAAEISNKAKRKAYFENFNKLFKEQKE
ncbi:MAG TPA: amidohydrolase family protein [Candidatus Bathyarchaeia archaeon]|nr:amidohydrolase family protein [Candidatus Bathyarchaeia archaeon]